MLDRKGFVAWAAGAALACAGIARADTAGPATPANDGFSLRPTQLQDTSTAPASAPTPPPTPLMAVIGASPLNNAFNALNLSAGGYVEGSLTYSMANPPNDIIAQNVFNIRDKNPVLDQLDFYLQRSVATSGSNWDFGFRGEVIYGVDTATIHSSGLFDNPSTLGIPAGGGYYRSRTSPENQFDVNQAYINIYAPIGSGVGIQIGKFDTLLGYETINPTTNPLFSHSYLFGYAIPFTQTGVLGSYALNANWSFKAGITRGWNQTFKDNNGSPDFLGQVAWTPNTNDTGTNYTLNISEGPQTTGDVSDYWTVLDFIYNTHIGDNLKLALNVDYGDAPGLLGNGHAAQWYGAAGYAMYTINPMLTVNARAEVYDDANGVTVALAPGATQYYEATVGVAITPFASNDILKNFVIRPEGRIDYASHPAFDGGTKNYEAQLAVDAYFIF